MAERAELEAVEEQLRELDKQLRQPSASAVQNIGGGGGGGGKQNAAGDELTRRGRGARRRGQPRGGTPAGMAGGKPRVVIKF